MSAPAGVTRAVVLARGLGTRMRAHDARAGALTAEQAAVAARGVKTMIPVDGGRPFLSYLLDALVQAGITSICLVIGPEHAEIRAACAGDAAPAGVTIAFAVQREATGTADAVTCAEPFVGDTPFLVMNADNYYPPEVLRALRLGPVPSVAAFSRAGLLRNGHIPAERIARYALLDVAPDGTLRRIVEKPDAETARTMGDARVSMNSWAFTPAIFAACRAVPLSPRGERELPLAVQHAIDRHGMRVHALPVEAAVLDLSHQSDIQRVASALRRDADA